MPSISGDTARTSPAQELLPSKTRAGPGASAARGKAVAAAEARVAVAGEVVKAVVVVAAVVVGETAGQPADNHPSYY